MKYNLLRFQTSGRLTIFFNNHDYQVSTSLMKENKRYKRLKTAKWISIRKLVPALSLTVRSAGLKQRPTDAGSTKNMEIATPIGSFQNKASKDSAKILNRHQTYNQSKNYQSASI